MSQGKWTKGRRKTHSLPTVSALNKGENQLAGTEANVALLAAVSFA